MSSPQQSYNTYGGRNDRAFARGRTQWAGMSIDEILDVLSTMEPGRAGGDVNTILQAIESVRRAGVVVVPAVFLDDDEVVRFLPGLIAVLRDGGYRDEEILRWLFTEDDSLKINILSGALSILACLAAIALIMATVVIFKMKRHRYAWVTIIPAVQKPHWNPKLSTKDCWTGCRSSGVPKR